MTDRTHVGLYIAYEHFIFCVNGRILYTLTIHTVL